MKPVADNVLICEPEGNVESGTAMGAAYEFEKIEGSAIVKPGSANKVQSKPTEGVVRAVGPEVTIGGTAGAVLAEGERVLFRGWTGIEIRINGKPHVLTSQKHVLAVVDDGERID